MTAAEQEAFLRQHRASNSVVMPAFGLDAAGKTVKQDGWRLSIRVPPGSALHVKQAGLDDSFRIFVAPTIEACWEKARAEAEGDLEDLF